MDEILIRDEAATDIEAISEITLEAFKTLEISNHTEQTIIEELRRLGELTVSLVAIAENRVVGHIAFSPVTMSDGSSGWFGLGPVSVLPEFQRRGIGSALIEEGLRRLKEHGAHGCCLVGHPEYYPRFGFVNTKDLTIEGVPENAFFVLSFDEPIPKGQVAFHEAFLQEFE